MRDGNGIVVRSLVGWLRRRGWVVVPPSGVGEIAGVCGVSLCGRVRGAARDEFEPESPALRAIRSFEMLPPGPYC